MNIVTHRRGRLLVTLDPGEIFPDDPGAGTPVMVFLSPCGVLTNGHPTNYSASATWHCASEAGDIEGYELSNEEIAWLNSLEDEVEQLLDY